MAARTTDRQRKKIIADYAELGSYNATAKRNGVSKDTVKRIVMDCDDFGKISQQKKEQNTADILAYMETQGDTVKKIIGRYLLALLDEERIARATPAQLTTALGTLIDKFTAGRAANIDVEDVTALAEMLK